MERWLRCCIPAPPAQLAARAAAPCAAPCKAVRAAAPGERPTNQPTESAQPADGATALPAAPPEEAPAAAPEEPPAGLPEPGLELRVHVEKRALALRCTIDEELLLRELPAGLIRQRSKSWRLLAALAGEDNEAGFDEEAQVKAEAAVEAEEAAGLGALVENSLEEALAPPSPDDDGGWRWAGDADMPPCDERAGVPSSPSPPLPYRVVSDDVKGVVNHVLMPHLLQKHADVQAAHRRLRAGEISVGECRLIKRHAGRDFDLRYASTIRAAKELAATTGEARVRDTRSEIETNDAHH